MTARCGACPHTVHNRQCRAKGPSRCVTLLDDNGRPAGIACGYRPPCPCPWRTCGCGTPVAIATVLPFSRQEEAVIVRGSAGNPAGTLAVWRLPDGTLAARHLQPGEQPAAGQWRGTDHELVCAKAAVA